MEACVCVISTEIRMKWEGKRRLPRGRSLEVVQRPWGRNRFAMSRNNLEANLTEAEFSKTKAIGVKSREVSWGQDLVLRALRAMGFVSVEGWEANTGFGVFHGFI